MSLFSTPPESTSAAIAVFALIAAVLLTYSMGRRNRPAPVGPGLAVNAESASGYLRVTWKPGGVSNRQFLGYAVTRVSEEDRSEQGWWIPDFEQTSMDDWGVRPGHGYRYTVQMHLKARRKARIVGAETVWTKLCEGSSSEPAGSDALSPAATVEGGHATALGAAVGQGQARHQEDR
jgi:hypothetical protein